VRFLKYVAPVPSSEVVDATKGVALQNLTHDLGRGFCPDGPCRPSAISTLFFSLLVDKAGVELKTGLIALFDPMDCFLKMVGGKTKSSSSDASKRTWLGWPVVGPLPASSLLAAQSNLKHW
jgi:hypothetical protein